MCFPTRPELPLNRIRYKSSGPGFRLQRLEPTHLREVVIFSFFFLRNKKKQDSLVEQMLSNGVNSVKLLLGRIEKKSG